jgi:hypothetical protein
VLAALLMAPVALLAQGSTGELSGAVLDDTGAALPGTTVTATNPVTGFTRTDTTAGNGNYRFPSLPVGTYNVTAQLQGYATVTVEAVEIIVASDRHIDFALKIATVAETLTVTAEVPIISEAASVGTVVSQEELENLPLNGRQFANLGVLAPGTTLAYNNDPTKPGQLVIQMNGGTGRNVNYLIDGGDNMDDTIGGALQNFNLESVQEFNIKTSQYKAEYGRSAGGVLSVVTKTGTNQFSGSGYWFYRDDSLNSQTETEKQAGVDKQPYGRDQYGASLGGPIVKDKIHFFATYEKTKRETSYVIDTGSAFPTYDGTVVPTPFEDELITAKASWNISAKQYLQVRYGYQANSDKYGASPLAGPDALGTVDNKYKSMLLSDTLQISDNSLNEFLFQYTKFDNLISADSSDPQIYYPSGFHTGENLNTPQSTHQVKYQFRDDFTFTKTIGGGQHDFKAGVMYIDEPTLGGDFSTGLAGQYYALEDSLDSPIQYIEKYGGFFGDDTPVQQYSGYFQDDWAVTPNFTLNVGVRYDLWQGFDLDQRSNPIWQMLRDQRDYDESYLQDFWDDDGVLDEDTNNWSTRIGFTWDLSGKGTHILRGGLGRFYDFPYTNATILFPASAVQSDYGLIYSNYNATGILNPDGSYFQPGDPLPPSQGGALSPTVEVASPTLATPYSVQASLGYSWRVNDWLGLNFDVVTIDYHDLPFRFRINPGVDADGDNVFEPEQGEQTRFPDFGNFRLWYGNGRASYDGASIGFRARSAKFELQGFYTYSQTEGNVLLGSDEFRITGNEPQSDIHGVRIRRDQSVNPLDPLCDACFGPLYTDAKHRFTIGAVYRGPWGMNFSGMFRYRSALPYTEHANADINGDGVSLDLLPGVEHVNTGRAFSFSQLDLRVSKDFIIAGNFGIEVLAELFNVFNETNPNRPDRFGNANTYAGDPLQGEQQLWQLGARIHF